jgi:RNA polymerase sigma-70 factor (ECF subfamily)
MSPPDEGNAGELVARARSGDSEAWGELYRRYAPVAFRFCRRVLPTREDAEDATTEIFLKVRLKIDQIDSDRPFANWLYRVTANHCWDELRRRRRSPDSESEPETLASTEPGPWERLLANESRREIRSALLRLSPRSRLALVMRYFAELDYREIASTLGVNEAFVGVLLVRARRRLREALLLQTKP